MTEEAAMTFRWAKAFRASGLGSRAIAVGMILATYANSDGTNVRPSLERVAREMGVSPRTVYRGRDDVLKAGFLALVRASDPPKRPVAEYRLTIPQEGQADRTAAAGQQAEEPGQNTVGVSPAGHGCPVTNTRTDPTTTPASPINKEEDGKKFIPDSIEFEREPQRLTPYLDAHEKNYRIGGESHLSHTHLIDLKRYRPWVVDPAQVEPWLNWLEERYNNGESLQDREVDAILDRIAPSFDD
ncbi:helix-turn-helix domain-containing protein [Blastococcus sp. SYSU DS0539]